jgi:hypothetical protein
VPGGRHLGTDGADLLDNLGRATPAADAEGHGGLPGSLLGLAVEYLAGGQVAEQQRALLRSWLGCRKRLGECGDRLLGALERGQAAALVAGDLRFVDRIDPRPDRLVSLVGLRGDGLGPA